jgi:hypothetical protein
MQYEYESEREPRSILQVPHLCPKKCAEKAASHLPDIESALRAVPRDPTDK